MTEKSKHINPEHLVPMDMFARDFALRIDLAYARPGNLLFRERIYKPEARLWLHEDLAKIVLLAAKIIHERHGHRLVLYDGLRTTTAQARMLETQRVQDHPQWLEEPRLLSPPGKGAHPHGMAIDLTLETKAGIHLSMGTDFDYLSESSDSESNPAHRDYTGHSAETMKNRRILNSVMEEAAHLLELQILLLPQEWWDFRLPATTYEDFAPLADEDLPPQMRMTDQPITGGPSDFSEEHFERLKTRIQDEIAIAAASSTSPTYDL